jgi:ribose 5-phosphate isomerase B
MKLFISSDHGGFELKKMIISYLKNSGDSILINLGGELIDLGPFEMQPDDDYVDFGCKLSEEITRNPDSLGILICRSGIGMSIIANKFKGIYAALCFNEQHAQMARKHNNANILCLDSDYGDEDSHIRIINSFLSSNFEGEDTRHGRRVNKIKSLEESNFK